MTDFDYDCYRKKQVAHSAVKKKNGSRSKCCTLPSDLLSPAQLRKKNGKVVQYNMKQPMTWEAFKALPSDLAKEYLDYLVSEYDVGAKQIADMFGVAVGTLSKQIHTIPGFFFRKAHRMDKSKEDAWKRFLTGPEPDTAQGPVEAEPEAPAEEPATQPEPELVDLDIVLRFYGNNTDPNLIANAIALLKCLSGVHLRTMNVVWSQKDNTCVVPW